MSDRQTLSPGECAALLQRSLKVVALTGAGASTAAGIPDFRGPRGLYVTRRYDPEKVFESGWFQREPGYFYEFSRDFVATVKDLQPTLTHRFLVELERVGRLAGVVTQNIDLLHQLAGSRKVIELHGSYRSAACLSCGKVFDDLSYADWEEFMSSGPDSPVARCTGCGGLLKPDIIFFGEPVDRYPEAEALVASCDLLLVLGSTLQVVPASCLPYSTEAATLIVNQGPVALPPTANRYFVDGDLDGYFRQVAAHLGKSGSYLSGPLIPRPNEE